MSKNEDDFSRVKKILLYGFAFIFIWFIHKPVADYLYSFPEFLAHCRTEEATPETRYEGSTQEYTGVVKTVQEGNPGEKTVCTRGDTVTKEEITKQPVDKIVILGEKERPPEVETKPTWNRNYHNSEEDDDDYYDEPSAICRDGTYSYSQSRSGTCSYHGGVSKWLY